MEYTVKTARTGDTDEIRNLMDDVLLDSLKNSPLDSAEMMESANRCVDFWLQSPDRCFHAVAVEAQKIIGVVLVKEHWNLVSLFVEPQYQRVGVGRALTMAAIDSCRGKSRYNAIYLNAALESATFYEKLGFVRRRLDVVTHPGIVPMQMRY